MERIARLSSNAPFVHMQSITKNAHDARLYILISELFVRGLVAEGGTLARDIKKNIKIIERRHIKRAEAPEKFKEIPAHPDDLKIIDAILSGHSTATDIAAWTCIPYVSVTKLLNELEAAGAIRSNKAYNGDGGQGGDRKTELHWITSKAIAVVVERGRLERAARDSEVGQVNLLDMVEKPTLQVC